MSTHYKLLFFFERKVHFSKTLIRFLKVYWKVTKSVVLPKVKHIYWFDMQGKNWL